MDSMQAMRLLVQSHAQHADLSLSAKNPLLTWKTRYKAVVMAEQAQENIDDLRKLLAGHRAHRRQTTPPPKA